MPANLKRKATPSKKTSSTPALHEIQSPHGRRTSDADPINTINKLSALTFQHEYLASDCLKHAGKSRDMAFDLRFKFAHDLSNDELEQCVNLIELTSRSDYEPSSFGWHPKRKRREMKEAEMRYLLAYKHDAASTDESSNHPGHEFVGFLSFMLTHDSVPSVPVLYIYEIHLTRCARGQGLGLHLMNLADQVAARTAVDKVMLTCFVANENARSFYESHGFQLDACSPQDRQTRNKITKVDYVILSKNVRVVLQGSP